MKLTELVDLIGSSTDMEVLNLLREVINPTAIRILGRPILEFSESRIEQTTGDKVLFNWWLLDNVENLDDPLLDIFDEEDQILIVSEISPLVRVGENAKVEQHNGILSIRIYKLE